MPCSINVTWPSDSFKLGSAREINVLTSHDVSQRARRSRVPFAHLVDPPRPAVQVIRAGEGSVFVSEQSDYVSKVLSACPPNARRDLYLVTAQPGAPRESEPHRPGTFEHVVLSAGRAVVGVMDEPVEIGPGDYVGYPGDVPHIFSALEPDTVAVMVSEHI